MDETCSIVHEYAVLYSYRILQKDKRWNDGKLRFYDFNNKMELLNDDDNIVETDFYPSSKSNPVVSGFFADGNQFKLPNNRALVEITDFLSIYTRDVSKLFKKNRVSSPTQTKTQLPKPEPPLASAAPGLHLLQPKRTRVVGLSRAIKREPVGETPVHPSVFHTKKMPPKMAERATSSAGRTNTGVRKAESRLLAPVPAETDRIRALLSYTFRQPGTRIAPRSSSHFRWLRAEEPRVESAPAVKLEPVTTGRKVDEADIIHDLSEFEDDEEFLEQLRQLKRCRVSEGDSGS